MYSCKLHFIVTDRLNDIANNIFKKFKQDNQFNDDAEGVMIAPDITDYFIIIDIKYLTYNTLAHEIYHAAVRVTEDRGIVDEESQAWLCGHLTETFYKFLEKKNLTIKHGS
jgi:hypothetical protein